MTHIQLTERPLFRPLIYLNMSEQDRLENFFINYPHLAEKILFHVGPCDLKGLIEAYSKYEAFIKAAVTRRWPFWAFDEGLNIKGREKVFQLETNRSEIRGICSDGKIALICLVSFVC